MRRVLIAAVLAALAVVAAAGYAAYTRDVQYRRLIDAGQQALDAAETGAAVEAFSGAIALRPNAMLAWYKRGETYRLRGDLGSAVRDLRQATSLDPGATRPLELLGDVFFALERYARAAETYEAYLALDDRSPRVLYKLGLSRFREGRLDAAESALTLALKQQERLPEAHYLLGVCLEQHRRIGPAIAALRKSVAQAPAMVEARELLAILYQRVGRPRDEARELEALAALDPDRVERQVALALAYARQGRRDLALVTLGRASRDFPGSAAPHVALGRLWLEASEEDEAVIEKAVVALDKALAVQRSSEAFTLLGRAMLRRGDLGRARAALERATAAMPVDPAAYPLLADAAERTGMPWLAREALVRAAALAGDADTRTALRRASHIAHLSSRLGDDRAAADWYGRALAMSPDDAQLAVRLARVQWKAGERDAAQATLERALSRRPGDPALVDAQHTLR